MNRAIVTGKIESLKANSGQAVSIGDHYICVGFHEDTGSDYRVWEWHGHVMLFDEENGYTPEYIYGNYFERINGKLIKNKQEQKIDNEEEEKYLILGESRVKKEIIRIILTGEIKSLKHNSGQAVPIGEHYICVGFHEDTGSDYRVWEWHGHVMLFDEENGYTPEYIYGNYFERVNGKLMKKKQEEESEKVRNLGLRELIESGESNTEGRILRRNMNAGDTRFISNHPFFIF
ncbi:uncharacterized protein LOC132058586 [Lycium ferocissimum]|uniref:uncharacterized protein LOC132058586 n=1 Tax=Lycium ferocissimum TaxID=112874 RepID=UPI002814F9E3|nr:uncharacterized protein LOC132058586 [Lycium ferocissimum]